MQLHCVILATLFFVLAKTAELPKESRAIGSLTLSNYDTEFTWDSRKILKTMKMDNIKLVRDWSHSPSTERIEWTQASRCWWKCKENYRLVDYYQDGNRDRKFKVFINWDTTPPTSFWTSGYRSGSARLHFGVLTGFLAKNDGALFFVIHPNSWGPYQHRFKTDKFTRSIQKKLKKVAKKLVKKAATKAAVAAIAATYGSVVPGLGTAIGYAFGYAAAENVDDYFGDYLRYIG